MDEVVNLNNLKRQVFSEFLNLVGRAYLLVTYSDKVILGKRGFTQGEKDNGIILVFNSKMNFLWDEHGISTTLVFGTTPQRCFIPADDIRAVYSPELSAQFIVSPLAVKSTQMVQESTPDATVRGHQPEAGKGERKGKGGTVLNRTSTPKAQEGTVHVDPSSGAPEATENIIKVDFRKKKKENQEG